MGTKTNPGKHDCYDKAEPDEPMFVLLARDPHAAHVVRVWAACAEANGTHTAEKIAEARRCAGAMDRWRTENRTDPKRLLPTLDIR